MTETEAGGGDAGDERTYSGILGAFPYAFRTSDSRLFKSYVVVGGLLTAFVAIQFAISVVVILGNTAAVAGGVFTFSRAFVIFVGFIVALPVVAPVLYVARRRRIQGEALHPRYHLAMALGGYGYLLALYVGLVASIPECYSFGAETICRDPPTGAFAPAVRVLYDLPSLAGLVPPALAGVAVVAIDRLLR